MCAREAFLRRKIKLLRQSWKHKEAAKLKANHIRNNRLKSNSKSKDDKATRRFMARVRRELSSVRDGNLKGKCFLLCILCFYYLKLEINLASSWAQPQAL